MAGTQAGWGTLFPFSQVAYNQGQGAQVLSLQACPALGFSFPLPQPILCVRLVCNVVREATFTKSPGPGTARSFGW